MPQTVLYLTNENVWGILWWVMSKDFSGDEDLSLRDECFHADLVMLRFHLDGIEQVLSSISQLSPSDGMKGFEMLSDFRFFLERLSHEH